MASQSNSDMWMGAASSDMRFQAHPDVQLLVNLQAWFSMPSNPVLELEEEMSWKASASSQNTTNMELKDNLSRGVLEEDWYTPPTPLMELPYSSPYGISDTRSSFDLLDSSLNFDISNTLITNFRSAPSFSSALGMGLENNHILEDLTCTGQGSSVGLLSSISPGGQLGRSNQLDSFSSVLPSSFNQGIINAGGSFSNNNVTTSRRTSNFPLALPMASQTFSEAYPAPPRTELLSYHTNTQGNELRGQPTLFQKRAASRRGVLGSAGGTISPASKSPPRIVTSASNDSSADTPGKESSPQKTNLPLNAPSQCINSGSDDPNDMGLDGDDLDDGKDDDDLDESGDGSGGPYEVEEGAGNGTENNNGKGNGKGKRGLPAKNLMAERRRRKKLNDRLYMLRSVVPKITKMDRASILGDAIEYLKELLQRINDIHNELEAAKLEQSRSLPSSPTPRSNHGYPASVKEECPVLPNPESQPPRVEVRKRDGQALNIHMFCARRPGLLLSTVRALDAMGLDVQQAVISCFNGFAMDLFRAEAKDVALGPEEIKAVLLLTAGCGSMSSLQ